ncbi:hypothetical protein FOZ62_014641, partial [Perkinsus olseni]
PVKKDMFGFQYVIVVVCHMSRFAVLAPLKRADSQEVITALRVIWNWGRAYQRAMSADGIRLSYMSRYSPWSNGICERIMPSIKNYLKGLSKVEYRRWSTFLSSIARRLNTKPLRDGSDQSPYSIIFGHHYREEEERRFTSGSTTIDLAREKRDDSSTDEVASEEEIKSLQSQRALILQEVLRCRDDRRPNHGSDQVQSRALPSVGSRVIRVGAAAAGDRR